MNTYKEQFDKLTRAYINEKVEPWECKACFVGNLLNGYDAWKYCHLAGEMGDPNGALYTRASNLIKLNGYSIQETCQLEKNFLEIINRLTINDGEIWDGDRAELHSDYENALFAAFESTLDLLKQIHISNGEVIDEVPVFVKRALQPA